MPEETIETTPVTISRSRGPRAESRKSKSGAKAPFYMLTVSVCAMLALAALSLYLWNDNRALRRGSTTVAQQELVEEIVVKVGKLMVLPEHETPTVATITDLEPLKSQPFFARAKIGDKVVIYSQSKKAILYDEKSNKIIEVAPITDSESTPAS